MKLDRNEKGSLARKTGIFWNIGSRSLNVRLKLLVELVLCSLKFVFLAGHPFSDVLFSG